MNSSRLSTPGAEELHAPTPRPLLCLCQTCGSKEEQLLMSCTPVELSARPDC